MLRCNQLIGFGGGAGFRANAVDFGATDYLSRASALTGAPNTGVGVFSAWFRRDNLVPATEDGLMLNFSYGAGTRVQFGFFNDQKFFVYLQGGGGTLYFETVSTFPVSSTWRHILINYNTNAIPGSRTYQMYVDSASDINVVGNSGSAFTNNLASASGVQIGRNSSLPYYYNSAMAELYFAPGQSLDISVTANREKFIKDGKPANLGGNGSDPTGSAPLIYLPNQAAIIGTNAGTGGNFTINGSPVDASTSPSD